MKNKNFMTMKKYAAMMKKRTSVRKLKNMSYVEMTKLHDFHLLWLDAMVDYVCIKCRKFTENNQKDEYVTGLCLSCEAKMNALDKKAFKEFTYNYGGPDIQGVPILAHVVGRRGERDGKKLGKELLKKPYIYRSDFFDAIKDAIVKKIEIHHEIR